LRSSNEKVAECQKMIQTMKNLEQRCDWFADKKSCATARGRDVVAITGECGAAQLRSSADVVVGSIQV